MKRPRGQNILQIVSLIGLIVSIVLCVYGWKAGLFTSQERLKEYLSQFGVAGPLVFILFQVVQVVIPVLPVGVGYLAGALMFGSAMGFLYSYIGICIGSILAFLIGRNFGRKLLDRLFKAEQIEKYDIWTLKKNRFIKLFALAICLPIAPDDLLCYLAGTTKMRFYTFVAIILLGKPFTIAMYSFGLMTIFNYIPSWIAD